MLTFYVSSPQVTEEKILNESLEAGEDDFMLELEELHEDGSFMSSA